jgi:galacturonosyltransferase
MHKNGKKILIISNHHSYTYNLRKEIIEMLLKESYEVHITLPYGDKVNLLEEMGCIFTESPLDPRGMNPSRDFKLVKSYYKIMRKIKPDIVLSYTIKPNLYGGLVCRLLKIPFIPNVTGLGSTFWYKSNLQRILINLYKVAFYRASCVFFQNESNSAFFIGHDIKVNRYKVIPGSGTNTDNFLYQEYPRDNDAIRLLFIGRVMKDKGIEEFLEVAKRIKEDYENVEFHILGPCDDEYKGIIQSLGEKKIIIFHGAKDNIKEYLKRSHAVIHPSYHEGMSNVLLEAAATGRPVLASNIPGCKEIFDEGIGGLGFEPGNVESLAEAIIKFIKLSNEERRIMGENGRRKVEREFNRAIIVNEYSLEINKILEEK